MGFISAVLLLSSALTAHGLGAGTRATLPTGRIAPCSRTSSVVMAEKPTYSSRVKMTVETRTPFRQGRIFFVFPSTIAAASIGLYVAITRLAAGLGGFRDDLVPLNDAGNVAVNLGVVAAAVYFLRKDLQSRDVDLEKVASQIAKSKASKKKKRGADGETAGAADSPLTAGTVEMSEAESPPAADS